MRYIFWFGLVLSFTLSVIGGLYGAKANNVALMAVLCIAPTLAYTIALAVWRDRIATFTAYHARIARTEKFKRTMAKNAALREAIERATWRGGIN